MRIARYDRQLAALLEGHQDVDRSQGAARNHHRVGLRHSFADTHGQLQHVVLGDGRTVFESLDVQGGKPALIIAGSVVALIALVDIVMALAVFFGRNWARILLMLSCVLTTIGAFIGNANGSEAVTLATSLPTVGLSIMVLLALSSHRAREYAARGRHMPKRIAGRPYEQAAI